MFSYPKYDTIEIGHDGDTPQPEQLVRVNVESYSVSAVGTSAYCILTLDGMASIPTVVDDVDVSLVSQPSGALFEEMSVKTTSALGVVPGYNASWSCAFGTDVTMPLAPGTYSLSVEMHYKNPVTGAKHTVRQEMLLDVQPSNLHSQRSLAGALSTTITYPGTDCTVLSSFTASGTYYNFTNPVTLTTSVTPLGGGTPILPTSTTVNGGIWTAHFDGLTRSTSYCLSASVTDGTGATSPNATVSFLCTKFVEC